MAQPDVPMPVPSRSGAGGELSGGGADAGSSGITNFLGKYTVPILVVAFLAATMYYLVYVKDGASGGGGGGSSDDKYKELGKFAAKETLAMFLNMGCKESSKKKGMLVCEEEIPAGDLGRKFSIIDGARVVVTHATEKIAESQQMQQEQEQAGAGAVVGEQMPPQMQQPQMPQQQMPQQKQQQQPEQTNQMGGDMDGGAFSAPMTPEDYAMYGLKPDGSAGPSGSKGPAQPPAHLMQG